jgi:hypothetical protein
MNTNDTPFVTPNFVEFPKMARLSREVIITEKIDGTNAQILITPGNRDSPGAVASWYDEDEKIDMVMFAGSRNRWLTLDNDNFGFAAWVSKNADQLRGLGPGRHFGEWWGQGIQRKYGLNEKRFSLFNVTRWCLHDEDPKPIPTADPRIVNWQDILPECCHLVPVLYRGEFTTEAVDEALSDLVCNGSFAAPGFADPEGVVVFHIAGNVGFKKTILNDEQPKSLVR